MLGHDWFDRVQRNKGFWVHHLHLTLEDFKVFLFFINGQLWTGNVLIMTTTTTTESDSVDDFPLVFLKRLPAFV